MGLFPKKTTYRKHQKGRLRGKAERGATLGHGEFGLQSLEVGFLTVNQIESARKALTHHLKRGGKVWLRVFADSIMTARAAETRMGGGKGAPIGYRAPVKIGKILFEIAGVPLEDAKEAMRLAAFKLPLKTRFLVKK
jgi:large subunit ribosomal protein L16